MSVLVPPMSKVMRLPSPSRRAACRLPAMPPAGPDSTAPAASRTESAMRGDAAVGLHDQHLARVAGLAESLVEVAQVARERRADVGVDHGGAEALVLLDLRQHLGRERDVGAGQEPLEGCRVACSWRASR